jgi:MFS family permease
MNATYPQTEAEPGQESVAVLAANDGRSSVKTASHETSVEVMTTSVGEPPKRTWRFWLVFASLCLVSLSTSLDSTIITTSLPTIVHSLGGQDEYVWIGNSFLLASTVVQPLVGQLADIFGRRWPMIVSVMLFMLGSGIAGGANGVPMLIAGRTVQGLGSGGIFVLLDIITCDLVPMRERGKFLGLVLSTGAIGSTLGPIIGGALAE